MKEKLIKFVEWVRGLTLKPLIIILPTILVMMGFAWNYAENTNMEWSWVMIAGGFFLLMYYALYHYDRKDDKIEKTRYAQ